MIIFYPRNIGLWVKTNAFDFNPEMTPTGRGEFLYIKPREKTDHKSFRDRTEFIQFLKDHGVRLDNPEFPLEINQTNERVYAKGHSDQGELFVVIQWTVIGWIRDNFTS